MTVVLYLRPELEAGLLAQAAAIGMSLEEYLLSVMEGAVVPSDEVFLCDGKSARQQAVCRMIAFGEKHHLSFREPVMRQSLHLGHRA